jgi:hypothetical protein
LLFLSNSVLLIYLYKVVWMLLRFLQNVFYIKKIVDTFSLQRDCHIWRVKRCYIRKSCDVYSKSCPAFFDLRKKYIKSDYYKKPSFFKLVRFFSAYNFTTIQKLSQYLLKAIKQRDTLLANCNSWCFNFNI